MFVSPWLHPIFPFWHQAGNEETGTQGGMLTHISVCVMHTNLAVHKISWKRCIEHTQAPGLGLNTSQTTCEANNHRRHMSIVKRKYASLGKNILFSK